jgi:hypothetical protein
MDYRLVKQFSNNAIDSFFNFFYKIADFFKVLIDLFWSFMDIWYQFFMIFINAWLYGYYLFLFIIDKITVARVFSKKASARHAMLPGAGAIPGLPSPKFGRIHVPSQIQAVSSTVKEAAQSAVKAGTPRSSSSGARKSVSKEALRSSGDIFRRIGMSVARTFKRIAEFLSFRMRPVREEPNKEKKSLIDEYMREYERKKH